MKMTVTVEFYLREDLDLASGQDLQDEIYDMFEQEFNGVAEYASAKVTSLEVE